MLTCEIHICLVAETYSGKGIHDLLTLILQTSPLASSPSLSLSAVFVPLPLFLSLHWLEFASLPSSLDSSISSGPLELAFPMVLPSVFSLYKYFRIILFLRPQPSSDCWWLSKFLYRTQLLTFIFNLTCQTNHNLYLHTCHSTFQTWSVRWNTN